MGERFLQRFFSEVEPGRTIVLTKSDFDQEMYRVLEESYDQMTAEAWQAGALKTLAIALAVNKTGITVDLSQVYEAGEPERSILRLPAVFNALPGGCQIALGESLGIDSDRLQLANGSTIICFKSKV